MRSARIRSSWVVSIALTATVGCQGNDAFHAPATRATAALLLADSLTLIGGDVRLGVDSTLVVEGARPGATVELYVGFGGEGPTDCTSFAPRCLDLLTPELYATGVADAAGQVTLPLDADDFPQSGEIAWQAIAIDPTTLEESPSSVALRHVMVPVADADLALVPVAAEVGIGELETTGNTHTGGVVWFDYNNDLWPDLFVVNGGGFENLLFRNDGDGTFTRMRGVLDKTDVTLEPATAKVADVDDDDDLDVLVVVDNPAVMDSSEPNVYEGGPNLLYINQGDGTFVESGAASGLVDPRGWRNSNGAFADYDLDGCIDVVLGNWAMGMLPAGDNFSRLMNGNCDGTFDDVTATSGTDGSGRDTLVTFWWDANGDRFPDLYMGNVSDRLLPPDYDPTANFYYNQGGVHFEDRVPSLEPWLGLDAWAAMGSDVGDIDLDGDWDLYVTDVFGLGAVPHGNVLYLGNGDGTLSVNLCSEHDVCGGYNSWPSTFADFNRDMWPDLWVGAAGGGEPSLVFVNKGDGTFEHHEQDSFNSEFSRRGGTTADYDGDGDVDVFVWTLDGPSELFNNDPVDTHHWLEVKLYGTISSWDAIGATVYVTAGGVRQMRRVSGGDSAHSQMDSILHFGLGDNDTIDLVEVEWPTGTLQSFSNVAADDLIRIDETEGLLTEEITAVARYDAPNDALYVSASSTWGGRSELGASGFGPLQYSARRRTFNAKYTGIATAPATIDVHTRRGAATTVTVQPF
jgi:hypothetical protein